MRFNISIVQGSQTHVAERPRAIKLGNPLKMETEMGPAAFRGQQEKIKSYIDIARAQGAQLVTGGKIPTDPELVHGFFVEPTIFTQVDNTMRIAREEVFGPVLSVIPFQTEEEVIQRANETRYGRRYLDARYPAGTSRGARSACGNHLDQLVPHAVVQYALW